MTCEQVKATGHFPLPGHIGALKAAGLYHGYIASGLMPSPYAHPLITQGIAGNGGQTLTLARQAKRLYVGNIPFSITEGEIERFFNATMKELNIAKSGENPVVSVSINHDKNYAFVEFRDSEEASAAMAFDGINFQGQALKIRRPKEYQAPSSNPDDSPGVTYIGGVSSNVQDTPNKLFIGGLPAYLNDEQVIELLKVFGELKSFNLVKDTVTNLSKGYAFCEYSDSTVTDLACQGLNNMELGDKKLLVQRASVGAKPMIGLNPPPQLFINAAPDQLQPTRILLLLNMVTPEELEDDEEYEEILADIEEEATKFGKVLSIKIPKDKTKYNESAIGKVFIEYDNDTQCAVALKSLAGRKFSDRIVLASYYNEDKFANDDL
jgi:splicing factor U2AF subunit